MKKLMFVFGILIGIHQIFSQENPCELSVKVENIKSIKGSLKVAIYNHEDHFLSKEVMSDGRAIDANSMEFSFKGLGKGVYAISIYQDENDNGKLDSNFMGIPSEPYAFSNNAKGMFGPPSFEDCQFEIKEGTQEIVISL
ncbi:DUF2141 domain-containing protein [Ekhidna sp.]|uniref:DUF2141 domain-containing protein n=1 Tax=Ekhidna sp. TaxID=2608089 RepID=UPI0032EBCD27